MASGPELVPMTYRNILSMDKPSTLLTQPRDTSSTSSNSPRAPNCSRCRIPTAVGAVAAGANSEWSAAEEFAMASELLVVDSNVECESLRRVGKGGEGADDLRSISAGHA